MSTAHLGGISGGLRNQLEYLVHAFEDLLRMKTFRDIPIVKVSSFLDLVAKGRGGKLEWR